MQILLKISTPKGNALKTANRIKPFIIPMKTENEVWSNPEDDTIFWKITGDIRRVMKVQRNALMYQNLIKNIFEHKLMQKFTGAKLSPEQQKELKEMLQNGTTIDIIKESTAQELVEENKTYWQRIKETFTKK